MTVLEDFLALARSYEGCNVETDPDRFAELVAPHGPPYAVTMFETPNVPGDTNSTCGVVAVGLLRKALAAHGEMSLSFPIGLDWWARTVAFAQAHGAYHFGKDAPSLGSIVHIERGKAQHWYTVVELGEADPTRLVVTSIDGGQKTLSEAQGGPRGMKGGYQAILREHRVLTWYAGSWFDVSASKPVVEWLDVARLLSPFEAMPPTDPNPTCDPL